MLYIATMWMPRFFPADKLLLAIANFLCALGVLVLYDTNPSYAYSQAVYYFIGLAIALPHFGHRLNIDELLRLPLLVQGELAYLLLFGTVWPMWLLYRGAEHLTATHTALYRYIQPLIAGTLAHLRHQAHFDRTNLTALVLIFVGILLTVIGYRRSMQAIRESLAPRRFRQRR